MIKNTILVSIALSAALLSGCANVPLADQKATAEAKSFHSPSDGKAGLYVFRDSFIGKALKKDVYINGECVGETANKTFFTFEVEGDKEHVISTESEFSPNSLKLLTEAGKNYFIRQYIKIGVFVGGAGLEQVADEEAKKTIAKLNLAVPGTCSESPNWGSTTK